jgi:hypothetical protein
MASKRQGPTTGRSEARSESKPYRRERANPARAFLLIAYSLQPIAYSPRPPAQRDTCQSHLA